MGSNAGRPRDRISETDRQTVLDAAAVLQVRRTETATALMQGRAVNAEIIGAYDADLRQVPLADPEQWTELLSVRPSVTADLLRDSLPTNRRLIDGGLKMISIYDIDGAGPEARALLAGETRGTYLVSAAPVQMKIVNRSYVLLQGPTRDHTATVMAVRSRACMDAAWRYWQAVRAVAFPVRESVPAFGELSDRQRQVFALLATGLADDDIASSLGVSVRTVRSDIASVLELLGVKTRFAAGVRLRLWADGATD